jgi:hypothetical protein
VHLQVAFLDAHREQKIIVYFLTCACVELHALLLKRLPQLKGLQVSALHGKLKQVSSVSFGAVEVDRTFSHNMWVPGLQGKTKAEAQCGRLIYYCCIVQAWSCMRCCSKGCRS